MSRLDDAGFKYLTYESAYVRRDEKARNQVRHKIRQKCVKFRVRRVILNSN